MGLRTDLWTIPVFGWVRRGDDKAVHDQIHRAEIASDPIDRLAFDLLRKSIPVDIAGIEARGAGGMGKSESCCTSRGSPGLPSSEGRSQKMPTVPALLRTRKPR